MKGIIISIFLSLIISKTIFSADHHVFLIHGIGSHSSAFDNTEVVLSTRLLKKEKRDFNFYFKRFDYDTGNDSLTTFDFAKSFSKFVKLYFNENPLRKDDKFSILAYSQGGLVTLNWLYHSFLEESGFSTRKLLKKLDSYITLATPFLGTEIVRFPIIFDHVTHGRFNLPVGKLEIRDMRFGSLMTQKIISIFSDSKSEFMNFYKNEIRTLNIIGKTNFARRLVAKTFKLGSDTTVPIPSAHSNFYYDRNFQKKGASRLEDHGLKKIISPHIVINAAHVSLPFKKGIANFPLKCEVKENCTHEAVDFVVRHLKNKKLPLQDKSTLEKTRSYVVNLRFHVPLLEDKKMGALTKKDFIFKFFPKKIKGKKMFKIYKNPFYFKREMKEEVILYHFFFAGRVQKHFSSQGVLRVFSKIKNFNFVKNLEFKVERNFFSIIDTRFNIQTWY